MRRMKDRTFIGGTSLYSRFQRGGRVRGYKDVGREHNEVDGLVWQVMVASRLITAMWKHSDRCPYSAHARAVPLTAFLRSYPFCCWCIRKDREVRVLVPGEVDDSMRETCAAPSPRRVMSWRSIAPRLRLRLRLQPTLSPHCALRKT